MFSVRQTQGAASMNSTPSQAETPKTVAGAGVQPRVQNNVQSKQTIGGNTSAGNQIGPKRVGYGMPCAKCKTYYAADLTACPVCKNAERISPTALAASTPQASSKPLPEVPGAVPDDAALEEERERFLREFKAQVYASHMQINAAASFRCTREENHQGAFEPAAVCQGCYEHLQQRVDVLEAALHMDTKEAAQVIYDAVWADPSDPNKTYQNAAQAVLGELRKRAGISMVLGPLKPLSH
jgi:hypothetical protein